MTYNKAAALRWRAKHPEYWREYMRQWRAKNADKFAAYQKTYRETYNTPEMHRKRNLKRYYGITPEAYDALLNAQGGVCAICGEPPMKRKLAMDHDHKTGRNRGLLCNGCNAMLNKFEKYPDIGEKALTYLAKYIEQIVRS